MQRIYLKFITLLFALVICNSCGNSSLDKIKTQPDMRIKNFSTKNYQSGELLWEMVAYESLYYFDENKSISENIQMKSYKAGKQSAEVKASQAIIQNDTKNIELVGDVEILSTGGNKLYTSRIIWNNKTKLMDTDEPVKIIRKNGDTIEGIGLKANYDLENYEIKRKVVAKTKKINSNEK